MFSTSSPGASNFQGLGSALEREKKGYKFTKFENMAADKRGSKLRLISKRC
jgi:hypothetical protein